MIIRLKNGIQENKEKRKRKKGKRAMGKKHSTLQITESEGEKNDY